MALFDKLFKRKVGDGSAEPASDGFTTPEQASAEIYDYPGDYAQRFDGVDGVPDNHPDDDKTSTWLRTGQMPTSGDQAGGGSSGEYYVTQVTHTAGIDDSPSDDSEHPDFMWSPTSIQGTDPPAAGLRSDGDLVQAVSEDASADADGDDPPPLPPFIPAGPVVMGDNLPLPGHNAANEPEPDGAREIVGAPVDVDEEDELDLASQPPDDGAVDGVGVHGWDPVKKEPFVGEADEGADAEEWLLAAPDVTAEMTRLDGAASMAEAMTESEIEDDELLDEL